MRRGRLQIFSPGLVFELGQLDPEPDDIPIYHRKQLKFSGISTVYYDRACFKLLFLNFLVVGCFVTNVVLKFVSCFR